MQEQELTEVLSHAWRYGHFRNPAYPSCRNVKDLKQARRLQLSDQEAQDAIRSMQGSDENLETYSQQIHGRRLAWVDADDQWQEPDGDPGPATLKLARTDRCAVPDFALGESEFVQQDSPLQPAGVGGWLKCDPQSDADHSVRIMFDDRNAPPEWKSYLPAVKRKAVEISADVGLDVRYISPSSSEDYESSVLFKFIRGGVIGYYYLPGRGCSRIPQGALDTSYQPDEELASGLWIHEGLGHGIGLGHTRGGIMNPSIIRTELSWRNDPSWQAVKRLYGGEPIDPGTPPPPPPGGTITFKGHQEIIVSKPGTYLVQLIESSGLSAEDISIREPHELPPVEMMPMNQEQPTVHPCPRCGKPGRRPKEAVDHWNAYFCSKCSIYLAGKQYERANQE